MSGPESPDASAPAPTSRPREPARPVAVVWCRQVDNEAESPGYMTVPESFPGYAETLETIRAVGHLTINVADTSDYWDPDPSQTLAYYPNLFLYPAFDGQYTCVGRMFLSREDRPRLGMKTLVLPTSELLDGDGFGSAILHWHSSMGGPRRSGGRPGVAPEPRLYDLVAEGFFFHLGATDPVLLLASTRWERAMQVILHLIRELPSSVLALTTVLAFPYFLPSAGSELQEFQRKVPVSLVLMRLPPSEAQGEFHEKRLQGWQASGMTVRDLTVEPLGGDGGKPAASAPLVVRYVRDRDVERLAELRKRVDHVELPGTRSRFTDPEFLDGHRRRKEAWRIGTAMENAALLMSRPRGRPLPGDPESAKRAQEYLDVGTAKAALPAAPHPEAAAGPTAPAGAPPTPSPVAAAHEHSVPVPTRIDPVAGALPTRVSWLAVPGSGDWTVLDERTIRRIVSEELERRRPGGEAPPRVLAEEISRSISLGVAAARGQLENEFANRLRTVEERLQRMGGRAAEPPNAPNLDRILRDVDERLRRASEETRAKLDAELDRRLQALAHEEGTARAALEARATSRAEADAKGLRESIDRLAADQSARLSALLLEQAEQLRASSAAHVETANAEALRSMEARVRAQIAQQVRESIAPERAELAELARRIDTTLTERASTAATPAAEAPATGAAAPVVGAEALAALRASMTDLESSQADALRRIDEVDTRTQALVDRLVPLVKDALVKIAQMRPPAAETAEPGAAMAELRKDVQRETQRIEAEMQVRINDLRRHVETTLGHQSRVWLTLIQQLSQVSGDRADSAERAAADGALEPWKEPGPSETPASSEPPENSGPKGRTSARANAPASGGTSPPS
jgi:hypothetical protein